MGERIYGADNSEGERVKIRKFRRVVNTDPPTEYILEIPADSVATVKENGKLVHVLAWGQTIWATPEIEEVTE